MEEVLRHTFTAGPKNSRGLEASAVTGPKYRAYEWGLPQGRGNVGAAVANYALHRPGPRSRTPPQKRAGIDSTLVANAMAVCSGSAVQAVPAAAQLADEGAEPRLHHVAPTESRSHGVAESRSHGTELCQDLQPKGGAWHEHSPSAALKRAPGKLPAPWKKLEKQALREVCALRHV
jgi:hypothetical protein